MRSSKSGRNQIMTWWAARKTLDTRFEQVRLNGLIRLHRKSAFFDSLSGEVPDYGDVFAQALFLRILAEQWKLAIGDLRRALLPQRKRRLYRAVRSANRTVGGREKVRPRNSRKQKGLARAHRPLLRKRARKQWKKAKWKSARTSHHAGKYVSQGRRGRPSLTENEKAARKRAKQAARQPRKVRVKSSGRIAMARAALAVQGFFAGAKDKRRNHDLRYGYRRPRSPEKRTADEVAKGAKPKHRHPGTGNPGADVALALRRLTADRRRAAAMRRYWHRVHHLAGRH